MARALCRRRRPVPETPRPRSRTAGRCVRELYRLGLVLLASAVVSGVYLGLLRRLSAWDLAVVSLGWWAAGVVGVSLAFPGASFLLTWSLVGGSLGLIGAALVIGWEAYKAWGKLQAKAEAAPAKGKA